MASLMDLIMREYGSVPSAPTASPMDMRRTFLPTFSQAATAAPMMPRLGQFDETNIAAPVFTPERRSPFDETNMAAPRFIPATPQQGNPLAVPGANTPVVAELDTANRPAPMASSVTAPAREQGFFEKLFKGPQYQSNNLPVNAMPQGPMPGTGATMPSYINYGDPNNAADFFRADALLQQQNPGFFGLLGGGNG
jgi:hypothetical protein